MMDSKQFLVENNEAQAKRHRQEMEVQREQMEQMGHVIRKQATKIALQEQTRRKIARAQEFRRNTEGEREEYNYGMWSPTSGESMEGERDNAQVRQPTVCEDGDYRGQMSMMKRFESQSNLAKLEPQLSGYAKLQEHTRGATLPSNVVPTTQKCLTFGRGTSRQQQA